MAAAGIECLSRVDTVRPELVLGSKALPRPCAKYTRRGMPLVLLIPYAQCAHGVSCLSLMSVRSKASEASPTNPLSVCSEASAASPAVHPSHSRRTETRWFRVLRPQKVRSTATTRVRSTATTEVRSTVTTPQRFGALRPQRVRSTATILETI